MITPTVGRVVWYHPSDRDDDLNDFAQTHDGRPMMAHVCRVWSDDLVNLDVVDPNGRHHARTSVYLHQGDEPKPLQPTAWAEWMPYQKGQAARTEAAETK